MKNYPLSHQLWNELAIRSHGINPKTFFEGVTQAIRCVTDCVACHDANDELQHYLGTTLLIEYKKAFSEIDKHDKKIELQIGTPQRLQLAKTRISYGHSGREMEVLSDRLGSKAWMPKGVEKDEFFRIIKKEGASIQVDCKFEICELLIIYPKLSLLDKNEEGKDSTTRKDFLKPVYHLWTFESKVHPNKQELDWRVVDIDYYLKGKNLLQNK